MAGFSLVQDVTNRRGHRRRLEETRERLEELTARYEALVQDFPRGGVFLFDEDLRYTVAGSRGLSEVGLTEDDFLGATPHDLFTEEVAETLVEHYRRALGGERTTFEQSLGDKLWQGLTIPVRDDGAVTAGMAVSRDVTEQRRRLKRLDEQTERPDEFASLVCHDLRNPLSVAEGYVGLAAMGLSDGADPETVESRLEKASRAHERIRRLVEDLLALARANCRRGEIAEHSVADVVEACWTNVDAGDAALEIGGDVRIRADRGQLLRLLENLVRNAVEHGAARDRNPGGSGDAVEHGAADDDAGTAGPGAPPARSASTGTAPGPDADRPGPSLTVTVAPLPDADGFCVADDGVGIGPERRDEVFETGHTTAEGGTGLGPRVAGRAAEARGCGLGLTERAGGARLGFRGVDVVGRSDRVVGRVGGPDTARLGGAPVAQGRVVDRAEVPRSATTEERVAARGHTLLVDPGKGRV